VSVHQGVSKFEHGLVAFGFVGLALFVGDGLFDNFLLVDVAADGFEVAFLEGSYSVFFVGRL